MARLRASGQTDFGGYLDLVVDFIFYSAIPLAFAIANQTMRLPLVFYVSVLWPQAAF